MVEVRCIGFRTADDRTAEVGAAESGAGRLVELVLAHLASPVSPSLASAEHKWQVTSSCDIGSGRVFANCDAGHTGSGRAGNSGGQHPLGGLGADRRGEPPCLHGRLHQQER
ncbi:hypothetical protein GCM10027063_34890 [Promicromonospora xylanilytica]